MMRHRFNIGFTLIEVLAVTILLALIGTYTWGYLRSTIETNRKIEQKTKIQQTGTSVISKLQDDISQVFFVESNQRLTYFKGGKNSIAFTSLSHDAPSPDDRECEEAEIEYTLDTSKESSETKSQALMRKEVPYLTGELEKDPDYRPVLVANGISSLEFAYSADGVKYNDEWDTTSSDHPNQLPKLVRTKLTMVDSGGREEYFESLIDLPMTADLNVAASAPANTGNDPSKKTNGATPQTPGQPPTTRSGKPGGTGTSPGSTNPSGGASGSPIP